MLKSSIALRRGRTVDGRGARGRWRAATVGTRYPLLLCVALIRDRCHVRLFDGRWPRRGLNGASRRRRRDAGRLVDRVLSERGRCALGDVRMMVTGIVLGPLCYDRRVRLRLSFGGSLVRRLVRRGEYFRGGERCSGNGVQLLIDRARGRRLLGRLHLMQMGGTLGGRCRRWLRAMLVIVRRLFLNVTRPRGGSNARRLHLG